MTNADEDFHKNPLKHKAPPQQTAFETTQRPCKVGSTNKLENLQTKQISSSTCKFAKKNEIETLFVVKNKTCVKISIHHWFCHTRGAGHEGKVPNDQ